MRNDGDGIPNGVEVNVARNVAHHRLQCSLSLRLSLPLSTGTYTPRHRWTHKDTHKQHTRRLWLEFCGAPCVGLSTSMKTGFIDVEVLGFSKWSVDRHAQTPQVLLAHDLLAEDVKSTPNFDKVVRAAVDGEEWAQNYKTHEVATREPP